MVNLKKYTGVFKLFVIFLTFFLVFNETKKRVNYKLTRLFKASILVNQSKNFNIFIFDIIPKNLSHFLNQTEFLFSKVSNLALIFWRCDRFVPSYLNYRD